MSPDDVTLADAEGFLHAVRKSHELFESIVAEPARAADMERYYLAVFKALNETHDDGEQDALCVVAGIGKMLGQLVGGLDERTRHGVLIFAMGVAKSYAVPMAEQGSAARWRRDENGVVQ